ncbi:MAG TPA: YihY/virulence factor BrkB family protein [Bacteroidales bacterium]|jgi:membrane protein|nr:YihY/virulence factor BrkB family protein [Bacteroidales bacterium]
MMRKWLGLLKKTVKKWWDLDPFREGAVIAYYAIFALPGLLVVIISVAGYFFGDEAVSGQLYNQISDAMSEDTAKQVQEMIRKAAETKGSVLATILGIGSILLGATGVFGQMQKSLNIIWEVEANPEKSGIWKTIRVRLFSFGLILSIAFLLLISLVVSSVLSAFSSWIQQYWSESLMFLFRLLHFVFSVAIITVLFALMFKFLPDAKVRWRSIWIGALVTSLLFVIGKWALGLYFGKSNPGSGYGAAGSIVLILLWTSYASMIVFFGNMFTRVYSDSLYGEAPPTDTAVKHKGREK